MQLRERGRIRLNERYGHWNLAGEEVVWFHGASIGELNGLKPLIEKLKSTCSSKILVTSVSVSGIQALEGTVNFVRLLPFDAPYAIERALRGVKIKKFVFGETEIWPGLFTFLSQREVPAVMVNARMSEKNVFFYRVLKFIAGNFWSAISRGYAGSVADARRIKRAGGRDFHVVGNLKYDFALGEPKLKASELFMTALPILVFGSVRPGEERAVLESLLAANKAGYKFNCVIAPRHKEKFKFFEDYFRAAGFDIALRSSGVAATDTLLLDTFGELQHVYALAEAAFIGATLVNIGGHNPIEAARYGVPVIVGPYTQNISDLVSDMLSQNAIVQVQNASDLPLAVLAALQGELKTVGSNGQRFADGLRGNTGRVFNEVFGAGAES
jgi:3-deoxy-D-manno-octulosonic-acid transferase